jgi:hypothetical protein
VRGQNTLEGTAGSTMPGWSIGSSRREEIPSMTDELAYFCTGRSTRTRARRMPVSSAWGGAVDAQSVAARR